MSNQDLDPSLVRPLETDKEAQEYQMKYLCDEATFMMFDLDRGGFINHHGDTINIDDLWSFKYKRITVNDSIVNGIQTLVCNFFISVTYNGNIVLDFEVYGAERRFRVKHVEGFHAGMFLNVLDQFRKSKFEPEIA